MIEQQIDFSILSKNIEEFDDHLSIDTIEILKNNSIKTIYDLAIMDEMSLLRIPDIGHRILNEIKNFLSIYNLKLKLPNIGDPINDIQSFNDNYDLLIVNETKIEQYIINKIENLPILVKNHLLNRFCIDPNNYIKKSNIDKKYSKNCSISSPKALNRISKWAKNPQQLNSTIIWSYFKAVEIDGHATIDFMKGLCLDKNMSEQQFKSNYLHMTFDGNHSHGKVFEDDGQNVWIWNEIEDELLKYKDYFFKGDN